MVEPGVPGSGALIRSPIFVVGAPRNGTTLTREILNGNPDLYLFNEIHFFELVWEARGRIGDLSTPGSRAAAFRELARWLERVGDDRDFLGRLTEEGVGARLKEAGGGYPALLAAILAERTDMAGAKRGGDSSPQDVLYIPRILEWFPDARIVGVARDPRGFLSSYKNYWRRQVTGYRERYNPVTMSAVWRSYMRALLAAKSGPSGASVCIVRYEDLVDDPEKAARALCEHVGVDFRPDMIRTPRSNTSFETASDSIQKTGIFTGSRDRWRSELTPTEIWLAERVCGRVMAELGYERQAGAFPPSPAELTGVLARLPVRLYTQLRSSEKPLTASRVRRFLSGLGSR